MSPTFRSLGMPGYRRYAAGQLLANTGVWMQRVAQDWLVLELTDGSALALGVAVGLQFLPLLLFSMWGGGLADRFPRRNVLLVTSTLLGTTALALGLLTLTGLATVPLVMLMAFLVGSVAAFDGPARQAFVSDLVDVDDLSNAVALNTASFNLGRVFGPAVAGLLIAAVGSGWVFMVNALGYVAVMLALSGISRDHLVGRDQARGQADQRGSVRDGVRYVRSRPDLVLVLAIAFFVGTFGLNFQLTIASMVTGTFGLGAAAFGAASTVLAVGSLAGSLLAARRGSPRIRLVVIAAVAFGAAAVTVAVMPTYVAFVLALPLVGMGALTLINAAQSYLQLNSDPAFRGRVMGVYTLLFMGGTPIGSPLVGWVAETFGARWAIALGGMVSAVAAVVVAIVSLRRTGMRARAHVRPRPHLHVGSATSLRELRPGIELGRRSARVGATARSLALPVVLVSALLMATPVPAGFPSWDPVPGDVDDLTSTRLTTVEDPRIDEASGMVVSRRHPGVTWILNDSKGGQIVYGVDDSGRTVAELTLDHIYNRDWEAMAPGVDDSGDPALWIADIGDNDARWPSVKVYRVSEPEELGSMTVPWRRIELTYPNGPRNAETFMIDERGAPVIVTKEALGAAVYRTDEPVEFGEAAELRRVGPAPRFLTDGALSPDGTQVALRSYTSLYLFDAEAFLREGTDGDAGVVYPLPLQPQGETLAYVLEGDAVLVGSEGVQQPIYRIGLPPDRPQGPVAREPADSGSWALGLVAIVGISLVAAVLMKLRGRKDQPSSPTT